MLTLIVLFIYSILAPACYIKVPNYHYRDTVESAEALSFGVVRNGSFQVCAHLLVIYLMILDG